MRHQFILFLFLVIVSCSQNTSEEPFEDETKVDLPKPIQPSYKLLKKTRTTFVSRNDLSMDKTVETTDYEYLENDAIDKVSVYRTTKRFLYDRDTKEIGTEALTNSIDTDEFLFSYTDEKISSIFHKHTQSNGISWYHAKTDFTYNEKSRLIRFNKRNLAPVEGRFQTEYLLTWTKDSIIFIPGEKISYTKRNIKLDENGNFESEIGSNSIYDNKHAPEDLVYSKHLLGYKLYGAGNILIYHNEHHGSTVENRYYEYNDFDFPTKSTTRYSDEHRPDQIIEYVYSE